MLRCTLSTRRSRANRRLARERRRLLRYWNYEREKGDLRRAAIAYRHALSLRPTSGKRTAILASSCTIRQTGRGIAEYRAAKRLNPTSPASVTIWVTRFAIRKTSTARLPSSRISIARTRSGTAATTAWPAPTCRSATTLLPFASCGRHRRQSYGSHRASRSGQALLLAGRIRKPSKFCAKRWRSIHNPASPPLSRRGAGEHATDGGGGEGISRGPQARASAQNHYSLAACLMP